jgi:5-methylcytosine-specific restriction endonuclease McrA
MLGALQKISSSDLVQKTLGLVAQERKISTEILWHFRAIETRRIYAELGYSSMYEFATRHLGYSEGAAHRRISASRLLQELPQVSDALVSGELSVTTASLVQNFFRAEKKVGKTYSLEKKQEIVQSIQKCSRLEAERVLSSISPQALSKKESLRVLSPEESELKLCIPDRLLKKLERVKHLKAHSLPDASWVELLEHLADQELKRIDPELKSSQRVAPSPGELKLGRQPLSTARKLLIWKKAQSRCEFTDPKTGKRCSSTYALQIDHIHPVVLGGTNDPQNLRLLCRTHNLFEAERKLKPLIPGLFIHKTGTRCLKNPFS